MGRASFVRQDEAGTNPHSRCTKHESCSNRLAVEQTTSSNDLDGLASHWALAALDELGHGWDKDRGRNITSVSTTFASLCANDVCTSIKRLLDMLRVANHVHVENTSGVQLLDDWLGRDSDSANEELCAALNDNVNKFIKLSLGVVIADQSNLLALYTPGTSQA